ncbi:DUF3795 domain-containing protein [Mesoaciditoga lauensis]|uniref:DUF3795 domain-containing protein n=1 Tax=Mesoaciditoga lauensis TaxID=1495039 RepID=UPI0014768A69|nr:DUF3795 domain-containing protein [Mesoaciditoga lauensis]
MKNDYRSELVAPCGIYCGGCRNYILGNCKGCKDATTTKCRIYKCCKERGMEFCGYCELFPCELHYSKDAAIYSVTFLDWKRNQSPGE